MGGDRVLRGVALSRWAMGGVHRGPPGRRLPLGGGSQGCVRRGGLTLGYPQVAPPGRLYYGENRGLVMIWSRSVPRSAVISVLAYPGCEGGGGVVVRRLGSGSGCGSIRSGWGSALGEWGGGLGGCEGASRL